MGRMATNPKWMSCLEPLLLQSHETIAGAIWAEEERIRAMACVLDQQQSNAPISSSTLKAYDSCS